MQKSQKSIIDFLGGKKTLYIFLLLILAGITVWIYDHVSFIFLPIAVFAETVGFPVVLAVIGYYLFRPVVSLLIRFGVNKTAAIFVLLLILIGLGVVLVMSVMPFLIEQAKGLAQSFPEYVKKVTKDIDSTLHQSILSTYYEKLKSENVGLLNSVGSGTSKVASETLTSFSKIVTTVTNVAIGIITTPILLFYLLKDGEKLPKAFIKIAPPKFRNSLHTVFHNINISLKGYIQGQIMVSLTIGILLYFGFLLINIDYPVVLAVLASVTNVVPYLGPAIAITPAIIIALVTSPIMLLKLLVVWTVIQLVETKLISPQIMGKSLRIHPVTIIFVLLTSGHLFGVVGVILGIPAYAIIRAIVFEFYQWYKIRYNEFYAEPGERYETNPEYEAKSSDIEKD
ncbi:AI-2E family transporter [Metabacillus sp. GX 13764]|uniref:AI-2E family transporter n=1 Tax=Metabacillus kandeliae TaxID=2900151 RepID=UPI001E561689|nr:AI-2E family transporter [Metabacillus kandeliae]